MHSHYLLLCFVRCSFFILSVTRLELRFSWHYELLQHVACKNWVSASAIQPHNNRCKCSPGENMPQNHRTSELGPSNFFLLWLHEMLITLQECTSKIQFPVPGDSSEEWSCRVAVELYATGSLFERRQVDFSDIWVKVYTIGDRETVWRPRALTLGPGRRRSYAISSCMLGRDSRRHSLC